MPDVASVIEAFRDFLLGELAGFADSRPRVDRIAIPSATTFFAWAEGVNATVDAVYFARSDLEPAQRQLFSAVLDNWIGGGAPMTPGSLLAKAREFVNGADPGTALLICHAVTRTFSKGGAFTSPPAPRAMLPTLRWQRLKDWLPPIANPPSVVPVRDVNNQPLRRKWGGDRMVQSGPLIDASGGPTADAQAQSLDYTNDGVHIYRPAVVNPASSAEVVGLLLKHDSNRFVRDTIFYTLFDKNALGYIDPNDWYHYFLMATMAYYAATDRVDLSEDLDRFDRDTDRWVVEFYGKVAKAFMEGIQNYEQLPERTLSSVKGPRLGWIWCNALSFFDGGFFGVDGQDDITRESKVHQRGAQFGLTQALGDYPVFTWYTAVANQLRAQAGIVLASEAIANVFLGHRNPDLGTFDINKFDFTPLVQGHPEMIQPFIDALRAEGPGYDSTKFLPVSR
jgi:hypothetical protein